MKQNLGCRFVSHERRFNPIRAEGEGCFLPPLRFLEHNCEATKPFFLKACDFSQKCIGHVLKAFKPYSRWGLLDNTHMGRADSACHPVTRPF